MDAGLPHRVDSEPDPDGRENLIRLAELYKLDDLAWPDLHLSNRFLFWLLVLRFFDFLVMFFVRLFLALFLIFLAALVAHC